MQERGVNQAELHNRSGIAVSRINNYLQGRFRTIKPEHVEAILKALGGGSRGGAALVQAYLLDRISDECQRWIEINIPGSKETHKWQFPNNDLTPSFAAALKDLYLLCVVNVKVRQRTREWIAIMKETST
jgi:hypothetical protein